MIYVTLGKDVINNSKQHSSAKRNKNVSKKDGYTRSDGWVKRETLNEDKLTFDVRSVSALRFFMEGKCPRHREKRREEE